MSTALPSLIKPFLFSFVEKMFRFSQILQWKKIKQTIDKTVEIINPWSAGLYLQQQAKV